MQPSKSPPTRRLGIWVSQAGTDPPRFRPTRSPWLRILLAAALVLPGLAEAGPREDVHAAYTRFLAAKSFRASVTDAKKGQQLSSMEFVAPDRYHISNGKDDMEQIIIGDEAYTRIRGRLMKLPVPVSRIVGQYRNQETLDELARDLVVTALGEDNVDGEVAQVYGYTVTKPAKADVKVWIGTVSGLPLQIESQGSFMGVKSTTRVRYSHYDDSSITIEAPG